MATKKSKEKLGRREPTLRDRAMAHIDDEETLLKRRGLVKRIVVLFPQHKKTPLLGRLAVWLLKVSKARLDAHFSEMPKK